MWPPFRTMLIYLATGLQITTWHWTQWKPNLCFFPVLALSISLRCFSKLDSHFKHLGVWVSLLKHIESICSKSCRTLGYILRTFSPYCDPEAILSFYKSQVLPVLEYACAVLGSSQKDQLFKSVQLFATRLSSWNWSANSDTLNYFSIISLFMVICTVLFFFCVTLIYVCVIGNNWSLLLLQLLLFIILCLWVQLRCGTLYQLCCTLS